MKRGKLEKGQKTIQLLDAVPKEELNQCSAKNWFKTFHLS